ncbi:MAG: hypothetical protein AAB305_01120 [Candidatus Zixiibacteriota bacterium]
MFILLAFLGGVGLHAQTIDTVKSLAGIEVTTSVDKAECYVGDLVTYKVVITHPSTVELIPPPLGANLGAFDVKDYRPDVVTKLKDGRIQSENTFVLSTFTTGDYVVPPVPMAFVLPDSSRKVLITEPVPIKVLSLILNAGDSADIKGLKAPFEFKRDRFWWYVGGAGLLLLVALALWYRWYRKKHPKLAGEPVDTRLPWEIAFEALALLKGKGHLASGDFKGYYIELTEIIRLYFGRIYDINTLDMTTDELSDILGHRVMPGNSFVETVAFLRHADLVKFAKLTPENGRGDADFDLAYSLIDSIRADEDRKRRIEVELKSTRSTKPQEEAVG